jgi:glucose/mannose transport system substrate-binding protein
VRSADNRKVWTAFGQAREMVDDSYSGRDWNMATNMVIEGKAAGQIMGDWAQGEFGVAKKVAGKDYDCLPGLGFHALLDTGGDSFYFPKNSNPDISKAQLELASMLLSKETQVKFNLAKGSLPVRGDVDLTAANACMKKGLEILATPENVLPGATQLLTPDTIGQLQDLSLQFFSSKMSVDDAIEKQAAIIKQAQ